MTNISHVLSRRPGRLGGLLPDAAHHRCLLCAAYSDRSRSDSEQLQETISQLKAGDRIVTTGGVIGTITTVRDTSFLIRSADKSILEIARSAVAGIDEEEKK